MHEVISKYNHTSHPDRDMDMDMERLKDHLKRHQTQEVTHYMGASSSPSPFLMPAEFYKSLLASAVLQQQQQQKCDAIRFYSQTPSPILASSATPSPSSARSHLPTNLLFSSAAAAAVCAAAAESASASAKRSHQVKTEQDEQEPQEPQGDVSQEEEQHVIEKSTGRQHKPHSNNNNNNNNSYSWSSNNNEVVPTTPPTPPIEGNATQATSVSAINLNQTQPASQTRPNFGSSIKSPPEPANATTTAATSAAATCKSQEHHSGSGSGSSSSSNPNSRAASVAAAAAAAAAANMPIGGVQGQNPTQGLVHWMSAVMAEHMTGQTHHDPTAAVGMHYMWNGNVDHAKDISDYNLWPPTPRSHQHASEHHPMSLKQEYEAKMNDHHHNQLQKGHFLDDNRLEHHAVAGQGGLGLGSAANGGAGGGTSGGGNSSLVAPSHHGNHVSAAAAAAAHHHSSAVAAASAAASLLVVPQPINASKMGGGPGGVGAGTGGHAPGGGSGRKYQCKMCPQCPTHSLA
ncbi:zinc finger protein rotund isoform X4 [Drosophila pseudoobscura]|uniref:Zinc finger protein rotund isoform X4 n=1 Tax=Drosophila pseudoobscura pseudoobscura TaxID=46245 RepID=A0A6I8VZJ3_DROPS|nr:zinc finger protein rotund isoform X4 [Drosophila pseudoobscura]